MSKIITARHDRHDPCPDNSERKTLHGARRHDEAIPRILWAMPR